MYQVTWSRWRQGGDYPQTQPEIEPGLPSRNGEAFVLHIESQDLVTDWTWSWVTVRRGGVDNAEEQGGCAIGPKVSLSTASQLIVCVLSLCPIPQESQSDLGLVPWARELE